MAGAVSHARHHRLPAEAGQGGARLRRLGSACSGAARAAVVLVGDHHLLDMPRRRLVGKRALALGEWAVRRAWTLNTLLGEALTARNTCRTTEL